MDFISNLALGFSVSLQPANFLLCFAGVALGVVIGILPGLGSAATIALLLPITYFLDTDRRHHHAGRHLVRLDVWRLDHLDPAAGARRVGLGHGGHRRLRVDQAGPRRRRAGHVDVQRLHCRNVRPSGLGAGGADAWPNLRSTSDRRNISRSPCSGSPWSAISQPIPSGKPSQSRSSASAGNGGARSGTQRRSLHVRIADPAIRHRPRADGDGPVRHFRGLLYARTKARECSTAAAVHVPRGLLAVLPSRKDWRDAAPRHGAGHACRLFRRSAARRRRNDIVLCRLCRRQALVEHPAEIRAPARSPALRRRNRPPMPRPAADSSRC